VCSDRGSLPPPALRRFDSGWLSGVLGIVLGFSQSAVHTYIFVVYLYATFVHSNLGARLPLVEKFLVTPRFHHWHHGIEKEAIDVNFAVHFPLLDRVFGTHHLPPDGRWPEGYGICGDPVPGGYVKQFLHPFRG